VCVELLTLVVYPFLFPPTREQPILIPARVLWEGAGAFVAGAVAVRAGGARALFLYIAFELALAVAQVPARAYSCSRAPAGFEPRCDLVAALTSGWTFWLACGLGVVASRVLLVAERRENTVLRAAGALAVATAMFQSIGLALLFLVIIPSTPSSISFPGPFPVVPLMDLPTYAAAIGGLAGGAFAGVIVARRQLAAPMLLALLLIAPSFALGVVLWRGQTGMPDYEPLPFLLSRLSWLWVPLVGALAVFIAWSLARRRNRLLARM